MTAQAQELDEDQLGAWYMYFFNKSFGDSQFGIQGDTSFVFGIWVPIWSKYCCGPERPTDRVMRISSLHWAMPISRLVLLAKAAKRLMKAGFTRKLCFPRKLAGDFY